MRKRDIPDWIIAKSIKITGFFASMLSIKSRSFFAKSIGSILYNIGSSRRKIALDNVSKAFPNKSLEECKDIVKGAFQNISITLLESAAFLFIKPEKFHSFVKYSNIELIHNALKKGNGVILLSGHYGNWEVLAFTAGFFSKIPVTVIVKDQRNKFANEMINKFRTRGGNKIIRMDKAARVMLKSIKNNEAIALLADQAAQKDKDVFIDFFGRKASTYEAPAEIALKFNVPIIMGFAVRQPDASYEVALQEINYDDLIDMQDTHKAVEILTERHTKILEQAIICHPDHWAWLHRRWKHSKP